MNHWAKCHNEKLAREISKISHLDGYRHTSVISLLTMENRFHPFSNANSKEDIHKNIASSPSHIVHSVSTHAKPTPIFYFRVFNDRISKEIGDFEIIILHDRGPIVYRCMMSLNYRSKII